MLMLLNLLLGVVVLAGLILSVFGSNRMRLFGLLHLLGQASLRMEQALWPEEYARMTREVEEALREADDPNAKSYTHEEVMQAMQERIDRARDKAMLIG